MEDGHPQQHPPGSTPNATELRTKRLRLRQAKESDIDFIHWLFSNPDATKYTKSGASRTIEDSKKTLDSMLEAPQPMVHKFVVELLPEVYAVEGVPIGTAGFFRPREIGYGFHPDYFRQGYATETAMALCDFFRTKYPGEQIFGISRNGNDASVAVLNKIGLTVATEEERDALRLEGKDWTVLTAFIDRTPAAKQQSSS